MELLTQFIDIVLHLDKHLAILVQQYGLWIYGILFFIIFAETGFVIFPFLPGDSLLFVAGALAAIGEGGMNIWTLCGVLLAGSGGSSGNNLSLNQEAIFSHKLSFSPSSSPEPPDCELRSTG